MVKPAVTGGSNGLVVDATDRNIERARFDWNRRVHLYDLELKAAHHHQPEFSGRQLLFEELNFGGGGGEKWFVALG